MQTLNAKRNRSVARALAVGIALFGLCGSAGAQGRTSPAVSSDEPAGYVIFPKIVVDTLGSLPSSNSAGLDTVVQLTNTDGASAHDVQCWYVSANGRCSSSSAVACEANLDCPLGEFCSFDGGDFHVLLTPGQPIAWRASEGAGFLPCDPVNPDPNRTTCVSANSGAIPPTEDPFVGELKCVETDSGDVPVERNDLKGEATIYRVRTGSETEAIADSATYNGIGLQARGDGFVGAPNNVLCLGGLLQDATSAICPLSEYAGCPAVLILNHFFDGAPSPIDPNEQTRITTDLTLVPCTEGLGTETPDSQVTTTAQMLVYNEFEQRFSTSTVVDNYLDVLLGDVDTRRSTSSDNGSSVFAVGVQGTLTGQTRIRGVESGETDRGHGLLGVAQEFYSVAGVVVGSAAFNLNYFGDRQQRDVVTLSVPEASGAAGGLCATCTVAGDCSAPMSCYSCSSSCVPSQGAAPNRCAPSGAYTSCSSGVY